MKHWIALAGLLLLVPYGPAQSPSSPSRWAILIAGISGEAELQKEYLRWLQDLHGTLTGPLQFRQEAVYMLFDEPARDPARIRYKSTRENLEKVVREIAGRAGPEDLVFIFIAGHGNYDGKTYRLNLPGPDPTAEELAASLYSIPSGKFVVVNTTTCSGASVPALAARGKIVLSATRSGSEKNQTHMGRFFVEAFKDGNADLDKNGRVSLLEAFRYSSQKVEEHYAAEGLLRTEHPVLEDTGDGEAQMTPGPDNGEGLLARTTYLDAGAPGRGEGKTSAEARAILAEMQALEKQIETLRYMKAEMPQAEYDKKLEELLLKLATLNAQLRKAP